MGFRWRNRVLSFWMSVLTAGGASAAFAAEVKAVGRTHALNEADIVVEVSGAVTEISAFLGDRVEADAPLLNLDGRLYAFGHQAAEAQLAQAGARAHEAGQAFNRAKELLARNVASQSALDKAEAELLSADSEKQLRKAEEQRTKLLLDKTRVVAPFGGTIAYRYVERGTFVEAGEPLFRLSDISRLIVRFDVIEQDIGKIRVGDVARLTFNAQPDLTLTSPISRIGDVAHSDTETFPVEIEIDNSDGILRAGYTVRITLPAGQ